MSLVPVQIDEMRASIDVRPPTAPAAAPAAPARSDQAELERLRPLVLRIVREELDRLRRQQG
jgi:hypothetical protein